MERKIHLTSTNDASAPLDAVITTACGMRRMATALRRTDDTRKVTCARCNARMHKGEMIFHD